MSQVKTVSCGDAQALIEEGYTYIDVRNELEFEQGHPAGAYNVPLTQMGDFGPVPNDSFIRVMKCHFDLQAKLVIGCGIGVASRQAARALVDAGYLHICDVKEGFIGCRDAFGRKSPGWLQLGLPVEYGQPEARSYEALAERVRR